MSQRIQEHKILWELINLNWNNFTENKKDPKENPKYSKIKAALNAQSSHKELSDLKGKRWEQLLVFISLLQFKIKTCFIRDLVQLIY